MRRAISVLVLTMIVFFCWNNFSFAVDASNNCEPKVFTKVTVANNAIEIIGGSDSRYAKYIIEPEQGMKLLRFDSSGKEISRTKVDEAVTWPGEEVSEQLRLLEWNGSSATFKLSYGCSMPACNPPQIKRCIFKVQGHWEKKDK